MSRLSRRELLAGLTSGALLLSRDAFARSKGADVEERLAGNSEYLFAPGLNYLNTAAQSDSCRACLRTITEIAC